MCVDMICIWIIFHLYVCRINFLDPNLNHSDILNHPTLSWCCRPLIFPGVPTLWRIPETDNFTNYHAGWVGSNLNTMEVPVGMGCDGFEVSGL